MSDLVNDIEQKTRLNVSIDKKILRDGDSLTKIFGEIGTSDVLVAMISKNSIKSKWCKKELAIAIVQEVEESNFKVIPVILPGENFEELRKQMNVELSSALRDKKFSRFDIKPYDDAFKDLITALSPVESSAKLYAEISSQFAKNPFWRVRAEHFSDSTKFIHLFEDPEMVYDQMMSTKPTLILGGRGSGKTMLLRSVRASLAPSIRKAVSFQDEHLPYFGVYVRATRGTFSLSENIQFYNSLEATGIFYDELILRLGQSIVDELIKCQENGIPKIDNLTERKISESISKNLRLFEICCDFASLETVIQDQIGNITDYVRDRIRQINSEYKVKSLQSENLIKLCKEILSIIPDLKNRYLCFLIDEYENLMPSQKIVINTLVKLHDASSYTFKIASKKTAFNISQTLEGQPLQEIDDYDPVDMDFNIAIDDDRKRYVKHVVRICERILREENFAKCNICDILEDRDFYFKTNKKTVDGLTKEEIMIEVKKLYSSRKKPWDKLTPKQKDYLYSHFGNTAEYRILKPNVKSYGGFNDLVMFSSGNLRIFLELCGMSYLFALRDGLDIKGGKLITTQNQSRAIERLSDYYLGSLENMPQIGEYIHRFMIDLGDIIREKLLKHPSETEASRLSISNPEKLNIEAKISDEGNVKFTLNNIVDRCVMSSIFHEYGSRKGRRGKSGYSASYDYILNRIFAQALRISPRPMLSTTLSCDDIQRLMNPKTRMPTKDKIIQKIRKVAKTKTGETSTLFDFMK